MVLQTIWRTTDKTLHLEDSCLDAFVWSDYAMAMLSIDSFISHNNFSRSARSIIWLFKMLYDYTSFGKIDYINIIRNINWGYQTDKAFAVSGIGTIRYLRCEELINPRVKKTELKHIILNGGQKLVSPERRFDAAIMADKTIFEE
jgi:hypothetical protein